MQGQHIDQHESASRGGPANGGTPSGLEDLIVRQCRLAPADTGAIFRLRDGSTPELVALHPQVTGAPDWLRIAARELDGTEGGADAGSRRIVALPSGHAYYGAQTRRLLLLPLERGDATTLVGAYVVEAADAELPPLVERIEEAAIRLEIMRLRGTLCDREQSLDAVAQVMEAVGHVAAQPGYRAAAHVLCNHVAGAWGAERVSLGFRRGRRVVVDAISHTEKINRRMRAVQVIEAAMEESVDQDAEVLYPASADAGVIWRAARDLAMSQPSAPMTVSVLPLVVGRGGPRADVAVLTIERSIDLPWTTRERAALRLLGDAVAPVLVTRRHADAWVGLRLLRRIRRAAAWLLGAEHTWAKLAGLTVIASIVVLATLPGAYRVRTSFRIEADRMQVVTAPFPGFIREVALEVGDVAAAGDVLARLDDTEQRLEVASARAELASTLLEADVALREGDHAAARSARLRAEQLQARIDLLTYDIERAALVAREAGVVLSGDLKGRINAPVQAGEKLFEVAPIEELRADVFVPEDQVNDIRPGQRGELSTAALPEHRIGFTVDSIDPVAEVIEDQNRFRVRVALDERPQWLRPGMEGVARIEIEERLYPEIWSRRLVNWVRMKLWI